MAKTTKKTAVRTTRSASRPKSTRSRRKKSSSSVLRLPKVIYAQVSPHSIGGVSMFEASNIIDYETVANFTSEPDLIQRAAAKLKDAGFDVLQATESTINIAGSPKTYEAAFGAPIIIKQEEVIKGFGEEDLAEFLDCPNSDMKGLISTRGTEFEGLIEGVAIEEPRYYMAESMFPPMVDYWHLDVPHDVSLACNADKAHRSQITGRDVHVAMVDSGWYRHPFFTERGYRVNNVVLGPGASNPAADESGHGTGESANIFAVAPDVRLTPVKMSFVNTIGAFNQAVGENPDIITCSWGSSIRNGPLSAANQALATAIATAVASGITVIFSAGNGHWGFPGQHPDVISAGGVFMNPDGTFQASDYASGFASNIYAGRNVPDVCGLVGMRPRAKYIMLPVEPGDQIDTDGSGGSHPNGDETLSNDGWASFSGTSAAAPQLAGVAALLKQACDRLTPSQIRDLMMDTARDVTTGNCHPSTGGNAAGIGADLATGEGLVDAYRATLLARLRCRTIRPIGPISPVRPIRPIRPISPIQPITPIRPIRPIQPVQPIRPIRPIGPVVQSDEIDESEMIEQERSPDVTEEDMVALEDMVRKGQIDPEEI